MLFSSPIFFLFFVVYFLLHLVLPARYRIVLIIVGSTVFYSYWNIWLTWIPYLLIILAFIGAIWMMDVNNSGTRRRRMVVVVVAILMPLLITKYSNFIYADVFGPLFNYSGRLTNWALPLGISFVTFTLIAYVIDVYQGRYPLERQASMLAGLVLFFPHLIAGPILRPSDLLPQLHRPRRAVMKRVVLGLAIFSLGLVKKLVFADPVAEVVDHVYNQSAISLTTADYLFAIYGFSLQIYCDFSGYTDMAIGSAIMLGVKLPTNFQRPYLSTSIVEFWRRWHITLSHWLRDYIYIALGGNRRGYCRQMPPST